MKYSKLIFFFALTVLLAFSSCKKEEISVMDEVITEEPAAPVITTTNALVSQMQSNGANSVGLDLGCFSVDLPFGLIVDGTEITINNEADFETALTDDVMYIDFVYPLSITYADGTTGSAADGNELGDAFASCIPDTGWNPNSFPAFLITEFNSCYTMVYPANLVDGSGNILTADNEDEFVDLVANNSELYFQFPLNLIDTDGNEVTATNDDELFTLLVECDGIDNPGGGGGNPGPPIFFCWDFVYPFDMIDQDGNTVVINNHDDICNAMLNGLMLEYVFPMTLVDADGEELIVNNMEELEAAWLDCGGVVNPPVNTDVIIFEFLFNSNSFSGTECYSINYPLEYSNFDTGAVSSLADPAATETYLNNGPTTLDFIVFPVTITEFSSGNQLTLDDAAAYYQFVTDCL